MSPPDRVVSPSITYWNRLEPSPRSQDIATSLAACVADGVWFLTRQWQLGEFEAVDGGSPAWIETATTTDRLTDRLAEGRLIPLNLSAPLEQLLGERRAFDLATRVELGQAFESMLNAAGLGEFTTALRSAYAIAPSADAAFFAGRAIDGLVIYELARQALAAGQISGFTSGNLAQVMAVLQEYVQYVHELLGDATPPDPSSWNPAQLEHEIDVASRATSTTYTSRPAGDAEVRWDTVSVYKTPVGVPPDEESAHEVLTLLPASVRFRGAPSSRWWVFDPASTDFGAIDAERRDLARLLLTDSLLRQTSDWYVIPIEQPVGTVMKIDHVLIRDVFGALTLVPPADRARGGEIFTIGGWLAPADHLLIPSSAPFIQLGETLEEVRFARDEMMNMVWAIEETIEDALGRPMRRYDASTAETPGLAPGPTALVYRLQTDAPEHWIPFVPVARDGLVMLEQTALSRPAGQILRPPLRIAEEALRRTGIRIRRIPARCRGTRGETFTWIARTRDISATRDAPAPRFDTLLTREVIEAPAPTRDVQRGSVSLIQSTFGNRGNFELIVRLPDSGMAHYYRDNDDPTLGWRGPSSFAISAGVVDAVTLIQSSFNNLEIVARIGDRLAHFWRNSATLEWSEPVFFATGVSGTPAFIEGRFGNFEVVTPLAGGGMAHLWRNNQTLVWSPPAVFAQDIGEVSDVSLIHSSFNNLEIVAAIDDRLAHFWRNGATLEWSAAAFFAEGVGGTPSFLQRENGGSFEVVAPLASEEMAHWSRNHETLAWSAPVVFGAEAVDCVSMIQSNFGGNLELAARLSGSVAHYWRESSAPFSWHGPIAIASF